MPPVNTSRGIGPAALLSTVTDGNDHTAGFSYTTMSDLVPRVVGRDALRDRRHLYLRQLDVSGQGRHQFFERRTSLLRTATATARPLSMLMEIGPVTATTPIRLLAVTNPLGFRSSYHYDSMGRVSATIDGLGNRTKFCL